MSTEIKYLWKSLDLTYDDNNYYGLKNIEYTFDDLDDYYKPILAIDKNNGAYQLYTCRRDKDRDMYIDAYLDKVIPYLRILIDEKKTTEKKIQLNVGINLIDTTSNSNKQFTFYVKTENVIFLPSDKAEDILDMLIASFYDLYRDKVRQCGVGSGCAYESVEGLCIHFHKIDLNRGSSDIRSPNWLKKKNATINPKDTNDPYCFIYSIVIALNHQELVTNPERISSKLSSHIKKYN